MVPSAAAENSWIRRTDFQARQQTDTLPVHPTTSISTGGWVNYEL